MTAKSTKSTKNAPQSPFTLTKTRLLAGVWEGLLTGAGKTPPVLVARHQDQIVEGITVTAAPDAGTWFVQVPVPPVLIADGVQTFVITDDATGATLSSFALMSGDALSEDIRAEVDLLRAELDMLKRAFRRHCVETM